MAFTKHCPKCKTEKEILLFGKDISRKDGLECWCKGCIYIKNKIYRQNNLRKFQEFSKKYTQKHPEKIKEYYIKNREHLLENQKKWALENPEKCKEKYKRYYVKHRNKINARTRARGATLKGKLNRVLTSAIYKSLRGNKNNRKWEELVDYTLDQLKNHLKKTLPENMTWNDYLEGKFHIDHIIPISAYNFNRPEDIDFKKCWALKNLQLLTPKENLQKSNKLDKHFQPSLALEI